MRWGTQSSMVDSLCVCLISKQFPPGAGGAETYAYELANGLAERGHNVDVYTQWIDSPDEEIDVHENVTVNRICKARRKFVTFETLWFSYRARRVIDFEVYDVIHGTMMPASTVAVTPFNDIETPVVLTSHGTSIGETKAVALETPADYLLKFFFHPMNVAMDYVASRDADRVIAISDHAYHQLTGIYRLDADDVERIPHGVDTDWFYPREEIHPIVDLEETTLLYVGRLGARKGLDLALRAVAALDDDDLKFLIGGTGRYEERLRALAAKLEIEEQVRFLGYVPDEELPMLYSSVDVFILPSRYEGFGLVLLEAMACRTPVIGTDTGGISTVIDQGTGLTPQNDVSELIKAMETMISKPSFRNSCADRAYNKATDSSWQTVINDVESLYLNLHSSID